MHLILINKVFCISISSWWWKKHLYCASTLNVNLLTLRKTPLFICWTAANTTSNQECPYRVSDVGFDFSLGQHRDFRLNQYSQQLQECVRIAVRLFVSVHCLLLMFSLLLSWYLWMQKCVSMENARSRVPLVVTQLPFAFKFSLAY